MGTCCSYSTVQDYLRSTCVENHVKNIKVTNGQFIQFVSDNFDHQTDTIDGKNTCHLMGTIMIITPKGTQDHRIAKRFISDEEILRHSENLQHHCEKPVAALKNVTYGIDAFQCLKQFKLIGKYPSKFIVEILRMLSNDRAYYSGTLLTLHSMKLFTEESAVINLSFINLPPSSFNCIYSTLLYVKEVAQSYGRTPVITFDQQLYIKAKELQMCNKDSLGNIFIRLGTFHLIMSLLAGIGRLMKNTGLKAILSVVYAEYTSENILSGKAYNRAIRAYSLLSIVLSKILHENLNQEVSTQAVESHLARLCSQSKTARLWVQFMDMTAVIVSLINAERTANYELQVQSMMRFLPYLAACEYFMCRALIE